MIDLRNLKATDLPVALREKFAGLKQRLWKVESTSTVVAVAIGFLLSFLLVFFSDRFWDTPVAFRSGFLIFGIAMTAAVTLKWVFAWILRPRDLRQYSILVQRRYRKLGDRLQGIVELSGEEDKPAHFSPELYHAAIEQVAEDAVPCDFEQAVDSRPMRRRIVFCVNAAILTIASFIVLPRAGWNALQRLVRPTADIPRYTLVHTEADDRQIVVHGEDFELTARVEFRSFWKPTQGLGRIGGQTVVNGEVDGDLLRFKVPGQFEPGVFRLELGDTHDEIQVEPVHRPALKEITAAVELPNYLRYPNEEVRMQNGSLSIVEGSEAQFFGKISRTLTEAAIRFPDTELIPLEIDGDSFQSTSFPLEDRFEGQISWKDELELTAKRPWQFTIKHRKDQPPTVEFPELLREMAILDTEVLELKLRTRDDFGVNEFGVNWEATEGTQLTEEMQQEEFSDASVNRRQRQLEVSFYFSPSIYQIPAGSSVEFEGYVTDYFPGREPVASEKYRAFIVSSVEHAEMVRMRLEALPTNLEEVSRLEDKIALSTASMLQDSELDPEEAAARLQEQASDQRMNAAQLQRMAQEGLETLRQAMRNPAFSDEAMKQWSEIMSEMQELAQGEMQQAAQSLSAAQQSQNPSARSQNLAEALQAEQDALAALEQLQQNINQDLDQLQAMTLAQRLRMLGRSQTDIEDGLMEIASDTIGLFPDELAPRFQAANEKMAETQVEARDKTAELEEELGRFFERTERENYGQVADGIKEEKAVEELERIGGLIEENISMEATEHLAVWAARFEEWADLLEPEESGGGGGEGGGGGSESQDLTKQFMALLRLREGEVNLRAQTKLVEKRREDVERHKKQAEKLSETQTTLQEKLVDVLMENPIGDLDPLFDEAHDWMERSAIHLRAAHTGQSTVELETSAIDVLTDMINIMNEQAQQGNSSGAASAQQMAVMLQMMSLGQGMGMSGSPTGGGSTSGGDTDRASGPQEGETDGNADQNRSVSRLSSGTKNLPTEFRTALEGYYRAIEQLEGPALTPNNPSGTEGDRP